MSSQPPLVFVPASTNKAPGGESSLLHGHGRFRELASWRERVLASLERAMRGTVAVREAVLKLKGDALATATEHNLGVRAATLTMPAVERYRGVVYENLDWATLPEPARRRVQDHVVVVDPLYGLLAPADEIPDYTLAIDATLPDLGKLSDFWRDPLALTLGPLRGRRAVWDMLPETHRRALPKELRVDLSIEFLEVVDGEPRKAGEAAKGPKGKLLRHLSVQGFTREALEAFASDGFTFDRDRSSATEVVFSKPVARPPPPPPKAAKAAKRAKAAAAPKAKAKKAAAKRKPAKKPTRKPAKKAKAAA